VSDGVQKAPEGTTPEEVSAELGARCNAIEEAYEFMLAYASQGLPSEHGSESGASIREYLRRADAALTGLAGSVSDVVTRLGLEPAAPYRAFIGVLERDARDAQAALQLAMAQPAISSQLVDNLNASIHLRALLTDLFLIDEVLKALRS
jgi:hypothetical protein